LVEFFEELTERLSLQFSSYGLRYERGQAATAGPFSRSDGKLARHAYRQFFGCLRHATILLE
jgi:hypothetical protein